MLSKVKNIIFDIGGVLVDLDFDRCIKAFHEAGFTTAEEFVSCYHPADFFGALERGEISVAEFYDRIREVAGVALSDEQIHDAYNKLIISIPVAKLRLIERLRNEGYKIYALSNINPVLIDKIYDFFRADGYDAAHYFDKMYLSFEMGVMKPTPKIYEMLIEDSGIDPRESLFIDDGKHNIDAAREFGFQLYLAEEREDFSHIFDFNANL